MSVLSVKMFWNVKYSSRASQSMRRVISGQARMAWVFDVSCGIHASKSWVMGAPIR